MRQRDLGSVVEIERSVFPEPWSKRLFEEELAQRTSRSYRTAWVGKTVVGFAGQMFIDDESHVNNIAVRPDHHGRGFGALLFLDLVHHALERGSRHLTLECRVGNDSALDLYGRFGLAPVGVRPRYYESGEDAFVMWVRDIDGDDYRRRLAAIGHAVTERFSVDRRD
jgi:[ribosomal protein S18]-alanine N-acetyltransferase